MNGSIPPSAAFSAHGRAFIVHLECIQYKGGIDQLDLKMLLAVNQITNGRIASAELTLQSILCHAAANLLRKISGEIFCKALQNRFFPAPGSALAGSGECCIWDCGLTNLLVC